jgi:DNA-binding NarL/FixJ family response regulator
LVIPTTLTHRELSVAYWLGQGKTQVEISAIMGLRERTVRLHAHNIRTKFDGAPLICAVIAMARAGMLDVEPPLVKGSTHPRKVRRVHNVV